MQKIKFISSLTDRATLKRVTHFISDCRSLFGEVTIDWLPEDEPLTSVGTLHTLLGFLSTFDEPQIEIKDNTLIASENNTSLEFQGSSHEFVKNEVAGNVHVSSLIDNIKKEKGCKCIFSHCISKDVIRKIKKVLGLIETDVLCLNAQDGSFFIRLGDTEIGDKWSTSLDAKSSEDFSIKIAKTAISTFPECDIALKVFKGEKGGYRVSLTDAEDDKEVTIRLIANTYD